MAFEKIEQELINECVKDTIDMEKIKTLIHNGADINYYDVEYEQCLYVEILDIFINEEDSSKLANLLAVTEFFLENGLILSVGYLYEPSSFCCRQHANIP